MAIWSGYFPWPQQRVDESRDRIDIERCAVRELLSSVSRHLDAVRDTHGLLRSQGENTRSAMRLEFTDEAQSRKTVVTAYVKQAVAVQRSGREVGRSTEPELPEELQQALRRNRRLAQAFRALTPGRRRSHVIHIAGAKQSRTRAARVEASAPLILAGKGRDGR